MRPADPARVMNVGPDFTPSYLGNLGSRQSTGGPGPGPRGPVRGEVGPIWEGCSRLNKPIVQLKFPSSSFNYFKDDRVIVVGIKVMIVSVS